MQQEGMVHWITELLVIASTCQGRHDTKATMDHMRNQIDSLMDYISESLCDGLRVTSVPHVGSPGRRMVTIAPIVSGWPSEDDPTVVLHIDPEGPVTRFWERLRPMLGLQTTLDDACSSARLRFTAGGECDRQHVLESYQLGCELASI